MSSQKYEYDFATFIGRFEPFHKGQYGVALKGLDVAEKLIFLVGSSHRPPELRNPWSFEQRKFMILNSFEPNLRDRVIVMPLMDSPYNDDTWIINVQTIVKGVVQAYSTVPHRQARVALIGHDKDHSSFYLSKFPQWGFIDMGKGIDMDSTIIRNKYFSDLEYFLDPSHLQLPLAEGTLNFLHNTYTREEYLHIYEENQFIQKYKQQFEHLPYPPTFNTADCIAVCNGHVLLVTRGAQPGKGLLAIPGGYVNQYEKVRDSAIRELVEETKIKVPTAVLYGSIKKERFFDYPYRSSRGRIFTMAYLLELEHEDKLPKVRGSDDASKAKWYPIGDLDPSTLFEDHYYIIRELLNF